MKILAILHNHPIFESGSNHLTLFQLDKDTFYHSDSMYIREQSLVEVGLRDLVESNNSDCDLCVCFCQYALCSCQTCC